MFNCYFARFRSNINIQYTIHLHSWFCKQPFAFRVRYVTVGIEENIFRFNCFFMAIIQHFNYSLQTFLKIISHSFTSPCQKHLNSMSSDSTVTIPPWRHWSMISVLLGNLRLFCSQQHYLLPRQPFQSSWHLVHLTQGRWIWNASCFVSLHSYCCFCD